MSKLLSFAAPLALSIAFPGLGTAIGGSLLGAGAAGSATLGSALLGGATGALTGGGLKGALLGAGAGGLGANLGSLGSGAQGPGLASAGGAPIGGGSGILGGIGDAIGLSSNNLPSLGSLGSGLQGATQSGAPLGGGTGVLGSIGDSLGVSSADLPSLGGLTGGGGGSTFSGGNLLSTALGGYADDKALKKAQERLLAGNQAQLANIDSYDAGAYLQNPEYQFKQAEGEKAINRSLGAQGGLFSGRALQEAAKYNQGLNTDFQQRDYQQYLDRIGAQNPLYASNANTQAATGIARSNNFGTSLSNILNPQQGLTLDDLRRLGGLNG